MPGAVATVVGLAGLRTFSGLVFEPLIARNAVSYGALGTVLIVQSWLIGVGWVLFHGQLSGRWFHDAWLLAWAQRRQRHKEPGSGQQDDEQRPGQPKHAAYVGGRGLGRCYVHIPGVTTNRAEPRTTGRHRRGPAGPG